MNATEPDLPPEHRVHVMPRWVVAVVAAAVVVITVSALFLLLGWVGQLPLGAADRANAQLDAVKVGLSFAVGGGGVFALYLATRRQRSTELQVWQHEKDLAQRDAAQRHLEEVAATNQAHQERIAASTENDATERRLTELYSVGAGQLGSDRAPVRLAGVYALERLAQTNPDHRQLVVDVICAYLRMPFELPVEDEKLLREKKIPFPRPGTPDEPDVADPTAQASVSPAENLARKEELQVRRTAAGVLVAHLQPHLGIKTNPSDPRFMFGAWHETEVPENPKFWPDTDVDLAEANLAYVDFPSCQLRKASFNGARFGPGVIRFVGSRFHGPATFFGATFDGIPDFGGVMFADVVAFDQASFVVKPNFGDVRFCAGVALSDCTVKPFFTGALVWKETGRRRFPNYLPDGYELADPEGPVTDEPLSATGKWQRVVEC